jgi:3-dehydroquinate dehydratase-2
VHQGHQLGLQLSYYQSNHEGALIDRLSQRPFDADAVLLNAGGLTHTSVSLGDCVAELPVPFIEVHFSAVFARESFRHQSFLAPHAWGSISGFGEFGYSAALDVLAMRWKTA